MLNRSIAPSLENITSVAIPRIEQYTLRNGLKVVEMHSGTQPVIKLELVFNAGRWFETKKMTSRTTASLIKEETKNIDAKNLAETIDYYGASISSNSNMDTSSIVAYSLSKYFEPIAELVNDIWFKPNFSERELHKFLGQSKHQMTIDLARNDIVAYRSFTENLYGSEHPYGYNSSLELYDNISIDDLEAHHKRSYFKKDTVIFVSGNIGPKERELIERLFGNAELGDPISPKFDQKGTFEPLLKIKSNHEFQTAIRVGRPLFNRDHEDYCLFFLMNTIFGGYYGSRLMSNLREEKALTYGIYSFMDTMNNSGYFSINTEVAHHQRDLVLDEINKEMHWLTDHLVDDKTLMMAKNYVMGQLLNMLDGPLRASQIVKTLISSGNELNFLTKMQDLINEANAHDVREIARKYFDLELFSTVYVGDM